MTEDETRDAMEREQELHAAHERIEELTNGLLAAREHIEDLIGLHIASLSHIEILVSDYLKPHKS